MVIHSPTKTTATPWPALLPQGPLLGKPPIPLARPATLVGSRQTAHLRLHSSTVSKAHALVISEGSKVHIRDLNSRTKVFVNGKVVKQADLREGDQVKIGRFLFRFTAGPQIQSTARRRTLAPAQLETDNGESTPLNGRVMVIGQREGSDLVIPGENVSTTHAAIFEVNGRRFIMDLGSRAGTLVNNHKTLQVELKIGDTIDIGGTEVRYTAAAGGATAPAARAPAAPTKSAESDLDDLLALESLSEPESAPKPSGKSKIFEPSPLEDDENAPLPLEISASLPEPEPADVKQRMEIESEPEPVVAKTAADDVAAEKAAEDELMALLEPEVAAEVRAEPEPPAAEAEAEPEPEPELLTVEPEVAEEPPVPVSIETKPSLVETPREEIELPPLVEELVEDEPLPIEQDEAPELTPLPVEEEHAAAEEVGAEPEPIAIEVEEPQAEPVQVAPALPILKEIPAPEPEPEPEIDIAPEPQVATTNIDLIPDEEPPSVEPATETILEDVAPPPVEAEPIALEPETVEPEPLALEVENLEPEPKAPPVIEPIAVTEPEPEPFIEPEAAISPPEPEPEIPAEPIALSIEEPAAPAEIEPEPEAQVDLAHEPPALATTNTDLIPEVIDEVLEETHEAVDAPQQSEPAPVASATQPESPLPPIDEDFDVEDLFEDTPELEEAAPIAQEPAPEPEPIKVASPLPEAPPVAAAAPTPPVAQPPRIAAAPMPKWVTPTASTSKFTPTVLTIKPPEPPTDFDFDDFLSGAKPKASTPAPAPVAEVQPPPPPTPAPPPIAEIKPPTPPAPPPPPEMTDEPDLDDLALLALDETETESSPEMVAGDSSVHEPEEATTSEIQPPVDTATASSTLIPEVEPAISATSTVIEEEDTNLLEPLPDDLEPAENFVPTSLPEPEPDSTPATPALESADDDSPRDVFALDQPQTAVESHQPARQHVAPLRSPGRAAPRARLSAPIPPRWAPVATAENAQPAHHPTSRRARRRLSILIVIMAIAMVVAALAVWKFIRPKVVVQGVIRYDGTNRLVGDQRDLFKRNQIELLNNGKVRTAAEALFHSRQPAAAGFFVEQDFKQPQLQRQWLVNGTRSDLELTYSGSNPTLDADRLTCLIQAIYEANHDNVSAASASQKTVDQKQLAAAAARAELSKIRQRREALEAITRPDPAELSAAQAAVQKLDQAWTTALTNRKAIAADVDRLQQPTLATSGPSTDRDSSLQLMSEKLATLNGRVTEAKAAAAKQAADARKSLNSSIEEFQSSIAVAQGMMKDNPALSSYITSAQKLHEASWKLQGDLIERQEHQQQQLVEYKRRLEEQVETHKRDMLEKDDGLKELNHLLELKKRELAALSSTGGLKRDVEKLRSDVATLQERIMARTVMVGEDKFYTDAIGGMKQIIDSVQKQLDADRAASEKLMNDLETKFRNTSPEIETLPAAQRSLAARLAGQVDAMQNARKGYTEAIQAQDADANARLKDLEAQAAALESDIALRRKELSAEQQKKLTEQQAGELHKKQTDLAAAEKSELAAREAYRQKIKDLDLLTDRERAWQSTREELQRLAQVEEPNKRDMVQAAERALVVAQRAADTNIAPQPPVPARVLELQDNRAIWVTGCVVGIGLIFGSLIFFTTHSEPRHRQITLQETTHLADDAPISS